MFREIGKTSLLQKVKSIYPDLTPATYALGAVSLLFVLIIMALCLKRAGLGCYWVGVSAASAAAIMLIPTVYIKLSGFTDRLIVSNESIYSAVTGAIANIFNKLILFECGLLAFGLLMLVMILATFFWIIATPEFLVKKQIDDISADYYKTYFCHILPSYLNKCPKYFFKSSLYLSFPLVSSLITFMFLVSFSTSFANFKYSLCCIILLSVANF